MPLNRTARRLRGFVLTLACVLVAATFGFMSAESMNFVDALYFSVVTVSTVGYGDLHPVTPAGKLMAVAVIIVGVGIFLGVVANATELLLERRAEKSRRERLNMVIGLFFAEIGTELLRFIAAADPQSDRVVRKLDIRNEWAARDFQQAIRYAKELSFDLAPSKLPLAAMRYFLRTRSDLLLRLLENPNLSENEAFTEMLRAVFHLKAELLSRPGFDQLPETDLNHLAGDAQRAYGALVVAWIDHMGYLHAHYPYLFNLAVRTNPFAPAASPIVR